MKKAIAMAALALMAVSPLFAAEPDSVQLAQSTPSLKKPQARECGVDENTCSANPREGIRTRSLRKPVKEECDENGCNAKPSEAVKTRGLKKKVKKESCESADCGE